MLVALELLLYSPQTLSVHKESLVYNCMHTLYVCSLGFSCANRGSGLLCIVHLYWITKIWYNQLKRFVTSQLRSYRINVISTVTILLCNSIKNCIPPEQVRYTEQSRPFDFSVGGHKGSATPYRVSNTIQGQQHHTDYTVCTYSGYTVGTLCY